LADLTGGLPEKYGREEPELQNLQKYWDIIIEAFNDGYYLGCGTPSHQDGHDASSDMGLAQGHAYSILRAVEVDKIKLLQIRNPWGRGEWKGDWSDDSELWTTRMQNILKWETFENDGIFWIEFTDFIAEFDDVYICRSLNERNGWKHITIKDKWEGKYAGGIPGFHEDSEFTDLPQYEITINTPGCGKGYWLTRQVEQENASTAKYSNYTLVSAFKNGQGGLARTNRTTREMELMGKVFSSQAMQSIVVPFDKSKKYPFKFTTVIGTKNRGDEGNYSLQVYA
jgi:hypothetical protein